MSRRSFNDPTSDAARQALLDNRAERSHPKRHRTRRRSKALQAARRRPAAVVAGKQAKALSRHHSAVAAYWRGEVDQHPGAFQRPPG